MTERYRKKKKKGKTHLMREGTFFDEDLGELHKKSAFKEETRNALEKDYEINEKRFFTVERELIKKNENEKGELKQKDGWQMLTGDKYNEYEPTGEIDKPDSILDTFLGRKKKPTPERQTPEHEETEDETLTDEEIYGYDDFDDDDEEECEEEKKLPENDSDNRRDDLISGLFGFLLGALVMSHLNKRGELVSKLKMIFNYIQGNTKQEKIRKDARYLLDLNDYEFEKPEVLEKLKKVFLMYEEEFEDPDDIEKWRKDVREIILGK